MSHRLYFVMLWVLTITLIANNLYSADDDAYKWGKITDNQWALGAPEDYPEANAVIIFDRGTLDVSDDCIDISYHTRIKILNSAGIEEVGNLSINYNKEYDNLKGLEAHTITPDGKKYDVKGDAIFSKTDGDLEYRTFAFPNLAPGCIVELRYNIRTERYWYLKPWYFHSNIFTMESSYSVSVGPGFAYDVQYYAVPRACQTPVVDQRPDPNHSFGIVRYIKTYLWQMKDLPPIKDEPYMSCRNDYRAALKFQLVSYRDADGGVQTFRREWKDIGSDFQKFIDGYCNKGGDIKSKAREIAGHLSTPREQSKAIFEYVAANYRTTSAGGTRWFANDKSSQLLEEGSGSAEEKNVLIAEMHKALEIPAWPVLISTRENAKFDPQYADSRQFNYMITFVQFSDGWEFLDASQTKAIYGILPPQCLTDGGFLVDGDKSDLVKITVKPTESYRCDTVRMYIAADGSVTCSTTVSLTGYCASAYIDDYDRTPPEEFVKKCVTEEIAGQCRLGGYECNVDSLNRFIIKADFTSNELVRRLDNHYVVKPVCLMFNSNPLLSEKRFLPVDFTYPFTYGNVVQIFTEIPPSQVQLPPNDSLDFNGINFKWECRKTDSSVVIKSKLDITTPEFAPSRYRALRNFFDKFVAAAAQDVTFVGNKASE